MTLFFSTAPTGRPSVRSRTSPRLKPPIALCPYTTLFRARPVLKDLLVRKAPPGRPVPKAWSAPLVLKGRKVQPVPKGHKVQLARLVPQEHTGGLQSHH